MDDLDAIFRENIHILFGSDVTAIDFKTCLFDKLSELEDPLPEHQSLLTNIGAMDNIYDLGRSNKSRELDHIEKLILKFIVTDISEYTVCINFDNDPNKTEIINNLCSEGVSQNPIDLLSELLQLRSNNPENYTSQEIERVTNRLLRYVPDIFNKIINISEAYETNNCSNISNRTAILKKVYDNIIKDQRYDNSFDVSGFGIQEFFSSFNDSIITKSIMLLFLAYIIGKIIGLFNIHYNVKQ